MDLTTSLYTVTENGTTDNHHPALKSHHIWKSVWKLVKNAGMYEKRGARISGINIARDERTF